MVSVAESSQESSAKAQFSLTEFNELRRAKPNVCVYCGLPADSTDHFVPKALREMLRDVGGWRKRYPGVPNEVWACRQCNATAGSHVFDTLAQKRRYIQQQYRRKHADLIDMPKWTDAELARLGPNMQQYVIASLAEADMWRQRIAWPRVYEVE